MLMLLPAYILSLSLAQDKSSGPLPKWWWGFTVDSVENPDRVVESLEKLPVRPVTRIVLDAGLTPADYKPAVDKIRKVSWVMAEPIDSVMTKSLTLSGYRNRMTSFMDGLKGSVDVWEIGNEVNGDWSGPSADVAAKVAAGYQEAKKRRLRSALTLFWSDFYLKHERNLVTWSEANLSRDVRRGVDYVLISFYPQSADGPHPNWNDVFAQLAKTFPRAKLGFGELGLADAAFHLSTDPVKKAQLARRYYRQSPHYHDRYIGGFFWWSYLQDAVPSATGMWPLFRNALDPHAKTEPE